MYRGLYVMPLAMVMATAAQAQDVVEAINLSQLNVQGTARSMGFGNTLGSIGGDASSVGVNPAGLGVYRSSELMFTPSLRMNGAESQYLGTPVADNNVRFNINNFGLVLTNAPKGRRYDKRDWKSVSFAFAMNRVADFNRNWSYQGVNRSSSMTQVFEQYANTYPQSAVSGEASNYPEHIGYESFLLDDPNGIAGPFRSVVPFGNGVNQSKSITERGHVDEYAISLGGNYKERLLLGATFGITDVKYRSQSSYQEWLTDISVANPLGFSSFRYDQTLNLQGTGVNLKLGAIYKFDDHFRLGAAFHTPSVYYINDVYRPYVTATVGGATHVLSSDNGQLLDNVSNYTFISPWRGVVSAAFVIKGIGFITADYEYVGYASMSYAYDNASYNDDVYQAQRSMNADLRATYQNASNVRLGAELLVTKYFMVRGGFAFYGSPYVNSAYKAQRLDLSAGIGFRNGNFFTDLGWVTRMYSEEDRPYVVSDYSKVTSGGPAQPPVATIDYIANNIAWTVGVKF